MVRLLDYLTGFVSLLALPFIVWWGVNQSPQSAAALQARLETNAHQALVLAGIDWARVEMDGQTAILTGAAPSQDAVEEAMGVVLRSSGPGGLLLGGVSQVRTETHPAEPVRPYVWTVEKQADGGLVLSGHVPSKAVRAALLLEAAAISATTAEDHMIVAAGAPAGNWQGIARFAIEQVSQLEAGSAVLSDTVLTLRGHVGDEALRARLTAAAGAVAAPYRGVALIQGVPVWSASLADGNLVLSGNVSSDADRRALLTLARSGFAGEVVDAMTVAPASAEGWMDGAKAGLTHLAAFRSGGMSFDPAVNGFIFEGEAQASTLQFLSEDMARAAGRWRFVIAAQALSEQVEIPGEAQILCIDALNQMLAAGMVAFEPERAAFRRDTAPALDQMAAIARRCAADGELELEIEGDALTEARAATLADFLERAGVARPRLAAIGYGPAEGVEGMDTGAVMSSDRPLRFSVRKRSGQWPG
ncbi:MAG: hypothetical protein RLO80_06140 [Hyphomonas sp.]